MDSDLESRVKELESELAEVQSVIQQLEQRLQSLAPKPKRRIVANDLSDKVSRSIDSEPGNNSPPAGPRI